MTDEEARAAQHEAIADAVKEAVAPLGDAVRDAVAPAVTGTSEQLGSLVASLTRLEGTLLRLTEAQRPGIIQRLPVAVLLLVLLGLVAVGIYFVYDTRTLVRCALTVADPNSPVLRAACAR
jgi:hypothetical protein